MAVINTILNFAPVLGIFILIMLALTISWDSNVGKTVRNVLAWIFIISVVAYVGAYWGLKIETMRAIIGM